MGDAPRPKPPITWKAGDWRCPSCGDHVFASKQACRCGTPRSAADGSFSGSSYAYSPAPSYGHASGAPSYNGGYGASSSQTMSHGSSEPSSYGYGSSQSYAYPHSYTQSYAPGPAPASAYAPAPAHSHSSASAYAPAPAHAPSSAPSYSSSYGDPYAYSHTHTHAHYSQGGSQSGYGGSAPSSGYGDASGSTSYGSAPSAAYGAAYTTYSQGSGWAHPRTLTHTHTHAHTASQGGSDGSTPAGWKPGDWRCPVCNDHVFASRSACRCGAPKPVSASAGSQGFPSSGFSSTHVGLPTHGSAAAPPPGYVSPSGWKPGDWRCPSCGDHVFATKTACRCGTPRPSDAQPYTHSYDHAYAPAPAASYSHAQSHGGGVAGLPHGWRPGDWRCGSCGRHVYGSRSECRCGSARPVDDVPRTDGDNGASRDAAPGASALPSSVDSSAVPDRPSTWQAPAPPVKSEWREGDWRCPTCGNHVYGSKSACRCGTPKPSAV